MTWQLFITAFTLGLFSSFHCVGMCGAIAFSLPTRQFSGYKKVLGIVLYNLGRICTYSMLGLLFGIAGRQLYLAGFQQWFSIAAGVGILVLLYASRYSKTAFKIPLLNRLNLFVQKKVAAYLGRPDLHGTFLLGMANGLLPCGLVYLAIAGAIATGTITGAYSFMAFFGLGTVPAMFLLSYFGFYISVHVRNRIKKMVPYVIALMGVMLIVRGMGLGIPYVSPAFQHAQVVQCH